jgi:hypothetical protein
VIDVFGSLVANHQIAIERGVLASRCMETLQAFFREKRSKL